MALHRRGDWAQAQAVYRGAVAEGRRVGQANTVQYALANLGHVELALGDVDRAERHFAEAHAAAVQLGADGNPVAALGEGLLARQRGEYDAARRHYATAQRLAGAQPDWTAAAWSGLAFVEEHDGAVERAEALHLRAYHLAGEAGVSRAVATAMEGLACTAVARGDTVRAAALLNTAQRWRRSRHVPPTPAEQHDIDRAAAAAGALLGRNAFERAFAASLKSAELFGGSDRPSDR